MDRRRQHERRRIVLAEDGRFITLCRATDPTETEIAQAEVVMRAQGVAGWPAVMEGGPWTVARHDLVEARALAGPAGVFADAAAAFMRRSGGG